MSKRYLLNPNKSLWLPEGSVRALIALLLTGSICYGFVYLKIVEAKTMENILFLVLGYYFGTKKEAKKSK